MEKRVTGESKGVSPSESRLQRQAHSDRRCSTVFEEDIKRGKWKIAVVESLTITLWEQT